MLTIRPGQDSDSSGQDWIGPAPSFTTPLPGPLAQTAISRADEVFSTSHAGTYPLVASRAYGSVIEDVDGNRFLDFAAGIAVCSTGHCHQRVTESIRAQAGNLIHLWGSGLYYEAQIELCEILASIAPGDEPKRVFLGNSGTEGIECAMKLARWYTKRQGIIAFQGAFHGRSLGALSLTSSKLRHREGFGPLLPGVFHAPFGDTEFIEEQLFKHTVSPSEIAAIVIEPIQGEGGYVIAENEFLLKLRELCDQYGILLVADEIQSGAGRTGKWWAVDHCPVVPDILVSAKGIASGMPLCAVIAPKRIMSWPKGAHGTTFGGNPVCCAAGIETLRLIESTYMANARKVGIQAMTTLKEIQARHSCLDKVRGRGLMIGMDVVENKRTHKPDPELRNKICQETFLRGVIVLPAGEASIRICPPLCIGKMQIEVGLNVLEEAVATVAK